MVAANAVPVEFLHGLGQHPSVWDAVAGRLPEWADPAISTIPSLSAPAHEPFSLDVAARWAAADLIDRSEDDAVVVGLSLGAQIAVRLAALEPGLVRALVLSAPVARPPKLLMRMQRAVLGALPARMVTAPSVREGGTGLSKADMLRVLDVVAEIDLRDELRRLEVPALVVVGGDDRANRRLSAEVAELIPDAELQVVPGVGHEWNRTHPERFAAAIAEWVERRGLA